MRDKVTRQCPQTTTFEEKGEPKQIQTKVPLLTSLTPYHYAKLVHLLLLVLGISFIALVSTTKLPDAQNWHVFVGRKLWEHEKA